MLALLFNVARLVTQPRKRASCLPHVAVAILSVGGCFVTLPAIAQNRLHAAKGGDAELIAEAVRLSYVAPAECPSEAVFRERVSARIDRPWEARPDALARLVEVVVVREDQAFEARMRFTDAAGRAVVREIAGNDCNEVVEGIAIVTSLAVESMLAPGSETANLGTWQTDDEEPEPLPKPPTPHSTPAPPVKPSASSPVEVRRWTHELAFGGGLLGGLGPVLAPLVAARWGYGTDERPGLLSLRVAGADTTRVTTREVQVRFRLLATRFEVCPTAPRLGARLSFPLCGGIEAGLVSARGYESPPAVVEGKQARSPWAAATVAPRLRLASRSAFVELEPSFLLLLSSWRFQVQGSNVELFSTPPVTASVAVAGGMRFP